MKGRGEGHMVFRVNRAGISRRSQLTGEYIRKWIANEGEGGWVISILQSRTGIR